MGACTGGIWFGQAKRRCRLMYGTRDGCLEGIVGFPVYRRRRCGRIFPLYRRSLHRCRGSGARRVLTQELVHRLIAGCALQVAEHGNRRGLARRSPRGGIVAPLGRSLSPRRLQIRMFAYVHGLNPLASAQSTIRV